MLRSWVLLLVGFGGLAHAAPPSDYRCKPGTTKPGVGCACPAGLQARRDGDNVAICYGRAPAPAKPATRTPRRTTRTPIAVAGAEAPSSPQHSFFLAEQAWTRAEALKTEAAWETAAVAFTTAVRTGKLGAALEKEALYAALLAWKNTLATADVKVKAPEVVGTTDAVTPLSAKETRMIDAFDLYIARIQDPNDPDVPDLKFLKANIYRRHNRLDEAIAMFREIVKQHIDADVAEYAVQYTLDSFNRLGRFADMITFTDQLLANAGFLTGKDQLREMLVTIKRTALAKRAMALDAEGIPAKAVECGKTFIEQYNVDPLARDSDMALYNAMVCFEKGEAWASSLKVFAVFEQHFAKSPLFTKAKGMAAIAKTKLAP